MPYSDYSYLDPIHIVWRKGTEDDPYIDRIEYLKILNRKVVLSEIPDKTTRVKIAGMKEINYDGSLKKSIAPTEFSVNYSTGVVQFHESQESNSANTIYKGKGFIQYPSNRIYHQDELNNVVESLDKIIERAKASVVDSAEKIKDYEDMRDRLVDTMVQSETATTEAKEATEDAITATDKALDAYNTTRLVFKKYVMLESDVATTYPNPEVGWTVQVYDTGIRYRWDGIDWIQIDLFGGAIPLADETIDGLMSKDDFVKLKKIDEATTAKRVLVFIVPLTPVVGIQPIIARFPFKGKVIGVKALCSIYGETDTEIAIEKSQDMTNWASILTQNVAIRVNQYFDDGTASVPINVVNAGDLFRLNIIQQGVNVQNITLEVIIETTI
jgi:hypothetical protein